MADFTDRSCSLLWLACPATHDVAHRWVDGQPLGVVDIFVACQSAADLLAQQCREGVLFVLAGAAVTEQTIRQFSESDFFVKLSAGQQPGVGCDLATKKLELQAAVELDPQIAVLAFTYWVPLSLWQVDGPKPCF